jgi:hypothetical protein
MSQLYFWLTIALTTLSLTNCTLICNEIEDNNTYFNVRGIFKVSKFNGLRLCGHELAEALSVACDKRGYNKRSAYLYKRFSKYNMTTGLKNILFIF